jgi:peptidoglycan/LPS O-acetylase OafA/YrhL
MSRPESTARLYFPGLHAVRAHAALSVVVYHCLAFNYAGEPFHINHPLAVATFSGWDAVTLFFVLSGFLITYLLLDERRRTGKIDVKAFYARRIFRIWPPYYLVIVVIPLLALIFPGFQTYDLSLLPWLLVLLPTIPKALFIPMPSSVEHLWSIGVEEQFYLMWPVLIRRFNVVAACLAVIVIKLVLMLYAQAIGSGFLQLLFAHSRFECMAVGGLGAWMVYQQPPVLRILYRREVFIAALVIVAMVMAQANVWGNWYYDFLISWVFLIILLNLANHNYPLMENRVTRFLGNISYGIYLFHMPVLAAVLSLGLRDETLFVTTLVAVVLVAFLSYRYYERFFLRLKDRYFSR